MRGTGPYADMLEQRSDAASRRLGLDERGFRLDTARFRVPAAAPAAGALFDRPGRQRLQPRAVPRTRGCATSSRRFPCRAAPVT